MLCCETWFCHNDLEGHSNFSSTIYSFSYSVLGTSLLWRSTVAFTYFKKISCKKYKKYARSPYCRLALVPPNFMKFGIRGQLTDVITCFKFLVDRFSGYEFLTPQNCHFPLTCCVALTTVWHCCATLSLKSVKSLCLLPVVLVLVLLVWSWR